MIEVSPFTYVSGCQTPMKRCDVSKLSPAEVATYDAAMTALKAKPLSDSTSFQNIANYPGKPFMCNKEL